MFQQRQNIISSQRCFSNAKIGVSATFLQLFQQCSTTVKECIHGFYKPNNITCSYNINSTFFTSSVYLHMGLSLLPPIALFALNAYTCLCHHMHVYAPLGSSNFVCFLYGSNGGASCSVSSSHLHLLLCGFDGSVCC